MKAKDLKYSIPKIRVLWCGYIQPFGFFKTAEEAIDTIKKIATSEDLTDYELLSPDFKIKVTSLVMNIKNK